MTPTPHLATVFCLLAQAELTASWPDAFKTLLGLIGLLCVVSLIFTVIIQCKKLFGRRPPISDELDKLEGRMRQEILESYSRAFTHAEGAMSEVRGLRAQMAINHQALTDAGSKREDVLRDHMEKVRCELDKKITDLPSKLIADLANAMRLSVEKDRK